MKILHYALGFPPYRTGGATKFCIDLLKWQAAQGHQTALLWPGRMRFRGGAVTVKDRGLARIDKEQSKIRSFEICNPLPVPYDEGICASDIGIYRRGGGKETYEHMFSWYLPDVIHIHTFMGLHSDFLDAARKRGIRCVFTAHDYFPICPKVTMFREGQPCAAARDFSACERCNETALSLRWVWILQSPFYRKIKDISLVCRLRKRHRDRFLRGDARGKRAQTSDAAESYRRLREHYEAMLGKMDAIHYNSALTQSVYEKYLKLPSRSRVIGITHGDIQDHRKQREYAPHCLRLAYLGPRGEAKGFFLLQAALDKLWKSNRQFSLDVYFETAKRPPYMRCHKRYAYEELGAVFKDTDLVIVPSIWRETFGYAVLEALSYGVPALISGHVGARDILAPGAGILIEDITVEKLYEALRQITAEKLARMNRAILKRQEIPTMRRMAEEIEALYKGSLPVQTEAARRLRGKHC